MTVARRTEALRTLPFFIVVCFFVFPAQAQYSGGSGTAEDPYQIATAADLIALGETPDDYDKHFILTADIDLDPNLPGGKVFDRAVIASGTEHNDPNFQGTAFSGAFDGNDHAVSNLTIAGRTELGLFGLVESPGRISGLNIVDANVISTGEDSENVGSLAGKNHGTVVNCTSSGTISGEDDSIGGLIGRNYGLVTECYSSAAVHGDDDVGGLVGENDGSIAGCSSDGDISGDNDQGGLVGHNHGDVTYSNCGGSVEGDDSVGGFCGQNDGTISNCYSTTEIEGRDEVGGLVGHNHGDVTDSNCGGSVEGDDSVGGFCGQNDGTISNCYSTGTVSGDRDVGGLVGDNSNGNIIASHSTGSVSGRGEKVGGLVGYNYNGVVTAGYSTSTVRGDEKVGGLVGFNAEGSITMSYSTGTVLGNRSVGGLVGYNREGGVFNSFWDTMTSGLSESAGGTGLTTEAMQSLEMFLREGWDFANETDNGTCDFWEISPGDYPRLRYLSGNNLLMPEGLGTAAQPYLIKDAQDLGSMWLEPLACYSLVKPIDLLEITWHVPVVPYFAGTFDGNGHVISNLHVESGSHAGLFGWVASTGKIINLGLQRVTIHGVRAVGGLVVRNYGTISACYSTGSVSGSYDAGGLVGYNYGAISACYSTGSVTGDDAVGGLVGANEDGSIVACYSTGSITGNHEVGGLVGENDGSIAVSYSTATVSGDWYVGGLVGENDDRILACYSTGTITGDWYVGGLVGDNEDGSITSSFWDREASGQSSSDGGTGLTTAEMRHISLYLDAGWDFVDEVSNGTCDYWQMSLGHYPRLCYQTGESPVMPEGLGTNEEPYLIRDAGDLSTVWFKPMEHYRLEASLDLSGITWSMAVVPWFHGTFEGNGYVISNLQIRGGSYLGLFGELDSRANISNLGLEAVDVNGIGDDVGGLAGINEGSITNCYSTGSVTGDDAVGGLVGLNFGSITMSYSTGTVSGNSIVGGLVGYNYGNITSSFSTGLVNGGDYVGGLVGANGSHAEVASCYSSCTTEGDGHVGGLVGMNDDGEVTACYCTGTVSGGDYVGGLVGYNYGNITSSFSTGLVSGDGWVGGLVGGNSSGIMWCYSTGRVSGVGCVGGLVGGDRGGYINRSYSTGTVRGDDNVGGLVGAGTETSNVTASFWNIETSGQATSKGGTGLTTAEMQTAVTFLDAGWDFADEADNGTDDIWWILEGQDYPRLWWERGGEAAL